jgi:diguanylate cyclase (GGDEF)-like protein
MTDNALRILLVEDDEDDYVLVQAFLADIEDLPTCLTWVDHSAQALDRLKSEMFDLLLVDYHLDRMNGLEFVREVQALGYPAPIIMLTGQGDRDVDLAAMRAGAVDYLEKDQITLPLLERSLRYAVQRSKALRNLRDQAIHDDLTGLYNRREFSRLLSEEISRCRRYGRTMTLLMFDIDKFKAVNDTLGHQAGDSVLRHTARALHDTLRAIDRPARYGGDEFAVILSETAGTAAVGAAERLGRVVSQRVAAEGMGLPFPLSLSIGLAEWPTDAETPETLIAKADQGLYAAKRQGGNRVVPARALAVSAVPSTD